MQSHNHSSPVETNNPKCPKLSKISSRKTNNILRRSRRNEPCNKKRNNQKQLKSKSLSRILKNSSSIQSRKMFCREYTMIKLWTKIKTKRKNNLNPKNSKAMNKIIKLIKMTPVLSKSKMRSLKSRRKRKNLDPSHTVQITASGRRKTDSSKAIKCSL